MCPFSHPFLSLSISHLPFSPPIFSPILLFWWMVSPRRAGEDHRTKQQNKLMAFHLRRGSTPPLIGGNNRYGSVAGQMIILYTICMVSYSLSLSLFLLALFPLLFSTSLKPLLSSILSCPSTSLHFLCFSISSSPCLLSFPFHILSISLLPN